MLTNRNFDGMKAVLQWRIGDIEMKMGPIHALVTAYAETHAFRDITNTTKNTK